MPKTTVRIAGVTALAAAVAAFLNWYGNRHDFFDLRIYMSAMRWWADGNPLYDYAQPDRVQGELYFTYPPFTALLLRPFASIDVNATIAIFTVGTALAIAVTTWWLVSPVADRHGQPRWFVAGLAIPLIFAIEPTRETITFGQINMLLVVLILGDLLLLVPRNSRWAGVGIGLATALKLYPGIFIVYLLAARRWRAAITASAAAAGATLAAAAIAPHASWQFWTHELWSTDRVGRTDYTGNQSLLGLLGRLTAPDDPSRLLWIALVALVCGYGLWRAARAARAGDEVAGLALTGLVGALASPITWTHHVYWFVPAFVVLVDAGLRGEGPRRRLTLIALAIIGYAVLLRGVVSFDDWGIAAEPTDSVQEFVRRNAYVLLTLVLIATLPVRSGVLDYRRRGPKWTDLPSHAPVG
ncbi:glycosyltransferase family 87 protein [Phytohabitans rumicis]|uniref:Polyprenol-phosphate-mannose-dependent alpha-(1-2)-phosphatidylinositol mannoside mannosyltransferase n=1 Tax=Phytohabitans rumicis TaxID=1076125 RepID=A0A6V8L3D2_9ACTN|nr:hypothetical protein Prum_054040 [Phytohabitans rumicis]